MSSVAIFGLCGAAVIGIGVYGLLAHADLLRRVLAFNLIGSGIFLLFGTLASRAPDVGTDPVPQAMVITGIVVALAATAMALTLIVRLFEATGQPTLPGDGRSDDAGTR